MSPCFTGTGEGASDVHAIDPSDPGHGNGAGLLILSGWKLRWTALLAALLVLADAVMSHPFWTLHGAEGSAQLLHFMKNIGFIGGLLLLALTTSRRNSRY